MQQILYRLTQFWLDLFPAMLGEQEQKVIKDSLSRSEYELFLKYSKSDQYHAYRVFKMLEDANHLDPDLLTAALLHDIGKAKYPITILDRVWPVLVKKLSPSTYYKWGEDEGVRWKRPFAIKLQHAAWGAEMAKAAGSSETAVSLIRRHQDPLPQISTEEDQLLHWLQWSDDQN